MHYRDFERLDASFKRLQLKQLLELCHRLLWVLDTVSDRARVLVDLVVVTALVRLVTEEVNRLVIDAAWHILLALDVLQAIRLVPAHGEDVERDLTSDGVTRSIMLAVASTL